MDYQSKIYLDVGKVTLADITIAKALVITLDLTVGQWEKRKTTGYVNNAVDNARAW